MDKTVRLYILKKDYKKTYDLTYYIIEQKQNTMCGYIQGCSVQFSH